MIFIVENSLAFDSTTLGVVNLEYCELFGESIPDFSGFLIKTVTRNKQPYYYCVCGEYSCFGNANGTGGEGVKNYI
jgi:hypothetical protein